MKALVTGGAGFIGRWVCKSLIDNGIQVEILDDLRNSSERNFKEFKDTKGFKFHNGSVCDRELIERIFRGNFDICIHAAAEIDVQESIDDPKKYFDANIAGTFNILEAARKHHVKTAIIGTCMVYDASNKPLSETSHVNPLSPYAASKLAGEELALSYFNSYKLPVTILRPFNTYGPFQKTNMEGSVATVFLKNKLLGEELLIFGNGNQTRDLLYAEDCAEFIVRASLDKRSEGQIINAGTGKDISINELAAAICGDRGRVRHVPHHHPEAEIQKLSCDYSKAEKLLGWKPKINLQEGLGRTGEWLKKEMKL